MESRLVPLKSTNFFGVEPIMKSRKLGLVGLIAFGLASLFSGETKGQGYLKINNKIGSKSSIFDLMHYDDLPASDGFDAYDAQWIPSPSDNSDLYSDIGTHKLRRDSRLSSSTALFYVKLAYNGNLTTSSQNWLNFNLPYPTDWNFVGKEITFSSERLPYGPVVDVRSVIANSGTLNLIDVPVGNYNPESPYGEGTLEIGTRLLSDLNDDGIVNYKDFALLSADWLKTNGKYVGDITGPNGIPDGNVDTYDLMRFSSDWLKTTPA